MNYLQAVIENTIKSRKQWDQFAEICIDVDSFKKKFHLRPTSGGVTIVSTLEEKPMRGIHCGKTKLKDTLIKLEEIIKHRDIEIPLECMKFQSRKKLAEKVAEEKYQAKMIVGMAHNQSLKEFLKVDKLEFIASEFILHDSCDKSDRLRIDIIGFDGESRLFLFELKEPGNTKDNPVEQLNRYIKTYDMEKREAMLAVLREYPICSVTADDIIVEGYAVYGYGEKVINDESRNEVENSTARIIKFEE